MIYYLLILIIIAQASEDGLWERGQKKWSKRIEALYVLLFFCVPVYMPATSLLGAFVTLVLYLFIRTYIFDPVMHLVAGWPVNQVGKTSPLWDKLMGRFNTWQFWVMRAFALAFSVFWYIKAIQQF